MGVRHFALSALLLFIVNIGTSGTHASCPSNSSLMPVAAGGSPSARLGSDGLLRLILSTPPGATSTVTLYMCFDRPCTFLDTALVVPAGIGPSDQRGTHQHLELRPGNLPSIAYYAYNDIGTHALHLVVCSDILCGSFLRDSSSAALEAGGFHASMVLDPHPKIVHYMPGLGLRFINCLDDVCDSTIRGSPGFPTFTVSSCSIAVNAWTSQYHISFTNASEPLVGLITCNSSNCSSGELPVLFNDLAADAGMSGSPVVVGGSGSPIVAFENQDLERLQLAFCSDAACQSRSYARPFSAGPTGSRPDVQLNSVGYAFVSSQSPQSGNVTLLRCQSAQCLSYSRENIMTGGQAPSRILVNGSDVYLAVQDINGLFWLYTCLDVPAATLAPTIAPSAAPSETPSVSPTVATPTSASPIVVSAVVVYQGDTEIPNGLSVQNAQSQLRVEGRATLSGPLSITLDNVPTTDIVPLTYFNRSGSFSAINVNIINLQSCKVLNPVATYGSSSLSLAVTVDGSNCAALSPAAIGGIASGGAILIIAFLVTLVMWRRKTARNRTRMLEMQGKLKAASNKAHQTS